MSAKVTNENTGTILYIGSYDECQAYIGENDLYGFDHIIIEEEDFISSQPFNGKYQIISIH